MSEPIDKVSDSEEQKKKKKRIQRSFPASTFDDATIIANAIQEFASGQKIRRITLFDHLGKSPESGASRQMIVNSSKYGLTLGGQQAEYLELTPDGRVFTDPETPHKEKISMQFKLAIYDIEPFKKIYEQFKGNKLPTKSVIGDFLKDEGYHVEEISECINIFLINSKSIGLLKLVAGAERLLPIEHILEELPVVQSHTEAIRIIEDKQVHKETTGNEYFDRTCFYITPIGEEGSEFRLHSDLFLNHIVEPAVKEFGLEVIRADRIGDPGMITTHIIEHIVKSRLVVADLSFHNPNVFYELALRHACRKPTVQIIRKSDKIPFDLDHVRTIRIDTSSIYSLVPQLEIYRSEITEQVRKSLNDPESVDNPISAAFRNLKVTL